MSCNCKKATETTSCITNLTIGTGIPETDYIVVFKAQSGRLDTYDVTSDADGIITLADVAGDFRIGEYYEVWVSLASASNINTREAITVDGTADVTCINIQFINCSGLITDQTITLA